MSNHFGKARPDDLIAEVRTRNPAMIRYAKSAPDRFDELLPAYRDKIRQLLEAEQVRYWKSLALSAAKAQRYELVTELVAHYRKRGSLR